MSIVELIVVLAVVIAATVWYAMTMTDKEVGERVKASRPPEELGLIEAIEILLREGARVVSARFKRKPVRKHSPAYLGKKAVRVTTLQTVCGR